MVKQQAIRHAQFLRRFLLRQGVEQATTPDEIGIFEAAVFLESLPDETDGCRYPMSYGKRCNVYPDCECGRSEVVRAGVSVKDPTPPQEIVLCAAMGPSGFICERPKGHPGHHCDGDNQRWSSEKASVPLCNCGEGECHGPDVAQAYGHLCRAEGE